MKFREVPLFVGLLEKRGRCWAAASLPLLVRIPACFLHRHGAAAPAWCPAPAGVSTQQQQLDSVHTPRLGRGNGSAEHRSETRVVAVADGSWSDLNI